MENSIAQVPEKFKVVEILGVILQSTAVLQELILIVEALSKKNHAAECLKQCQK